MAGEAWRSTFQIGKETVAGTGVAATRRLYCHNDQSKLSRERPPTFHKFATTTRNNTRQATKGRTMVGGTLVMPLSASEIIEILLMGLKGGVTPTGAGTPKLWTFVDGTTFDPATIEWHDGARVWEATGCYADSFKISGSVNGEITVSAELFGMTMEISTLTGSLAERVPDFIEGWETKLYIDAFAGTPGTTNVAGTLINWEVEVKNGNARKYFADNTQNANAIRPGELEITASLTFDAASSAAAAEFANWDAATKRMVRLEFGQNEVIDGADKKFVTIDLPGAWSALELGEIDDGSRAYKMDFGYVYDPTNAFGIQIRCQNARTAAWT